MFLETGSYGRSLSLNVLGCFFITFLGEFGRGMKALLQYLSERGSFPALITVFSSFVAASVTGALSAAELLCVVVIVGMQFYFQLHNKFFSRLVPIEWLSSENSLAPASHYRRINWFLAVVPLLFCVTTLLAWAAVGCAVLYFSPGMVRLARRLHARNRILNTEVKRLDDLSPQVAVYVSGLENVAYQINQWLPVLEELDQRVVIVVRQRQMYNGMHETRLPIIHARNAMHVERVLESGIQTVLYPANPMQNLHALRHFKLNHYFINHGESDKAVNQNKLLRAYDKLLVGGPLAHRRLVEAGLNLRDGQLEYVGRPQAEMALDQLDGYEAKAVSAILYAPTWEGFVEDANYSSVSEFGLGVLQALVRGGYKVVFKPHPYTGSRSGITRRAFEEIKAFCASNNVEVVDSLVSIHTCMNRSDLLITDVSSVLNEYLVTRKPVVLCVTDRLAGADLAIEFPSSRAAYALKAPEGVEALVKSIAKDDPLAEQREAVRKDSLGDFPEGALNRFKSVISASVSDAV